MQAGRGGKNGPAFRDDVVDENKLPGLEWRLGGGGAHGDREGLIVLPDSRPGGVEGRRGLTDRKTSFDACPERMTQSNSMQGERQAFGRPCSRR